MNNGQVVITLFSTSVPTTAKVKTDIARIKRILDGKRVLYAEVRSATITIPCFGSAQGLLSCLQLHFPACFIGNDWNDVRCSQGQLSSCCPFLKPEQVDLTRAPEYLPAMLAGSDGSRTLPQLHVNGKVNYCSLHMSI